MRLTRRVFTVVTQVLWLGVLAGVVSCRGESRSTIEVDTKTGVMSFRYLLGERGAKLGLPKKCGWVFGVERPPVSACHPVTAKWADGPGIDGWLCDGDALLDSDVDLISVSYDEGKLTQLDGSGQHREIPGNRFSNSAALFNAGRLDAADPSALNVFKTANAEKARFKMMIWPLLCLETLSNEIWEREMAAP